MLVSGGNDFLKSLLDSCISVHEFGYEQIFLSTRVVFELFDFTFVIELLSIYDFSIFSNIKINR